MRSNGSYVYFIRDRHDRVGYVGKGDRARPYGLHTEEVDRLRDECGKVEISSRPFSTAQDALLAESLIIQALVANRGSSRPVLNTAKTESTSDLIPLLRIARGRLRYSDLERCLLVKIGLERIDDRRAVVSGVTRPDVAAERIRKYWPLGRCTRAGANIRRLVAVTTAEVDPPRVVGIWNVAPVGEWKYIPAKKRWAVTLVDPTRGNVGGHVGKEFEWEGYVPQLVGYSQDVREFLGLD